MMGSALLHLLDPDSLGHILDWAGIKATMELWNSGNYAFRQRMIGAIRSLKLFRARKEPIVFPGAFVSQLRSLRELCISSNTQEFSARVMSIDRSLIPSTVRTLRLKTHTSFGVLTRPSSQGNLTDLSTLFPSLTEVELSAPWNYGSNTDFADIGGRLECFKNLQLLSSLVLHNVDIKGTDINFLPPGVTTLQATMHEDWLEDWETVTFPPSLLSLSLFRLRRYKGFFEHLSASSVGISLLNLSFSYPEDTATEVDEDLFWGRLPRFLTSFTLRGGPDYLLKEGVLLLPPALEALSLLLEGFDVSSISILPRSMTHLEVQDGEYRNIKVGIFKRAALRRFQKYNDTAQLTDINWHHLPPSITYVAFAGWSIVPPPEAWPHLPRLVEFPCPTRPPSLEDSDFSYMQAYPRGGMNMSRADLHLLPCSLTKLSVRDFKPPEISSLSFLPLTALSLSFEEVPSFIHQKPFYEALRSLRSLKHLSVGERLNLLILPLVLEEDSTGFSGESMDSSSPVKRPLELETLNIDMGRMSGRGLGDPDYTWLSVHNLPNTPSHMPPFIEKPLKSLGHPRISNFARKITVLDSSGTSGFHEFIQLLPISIPSLTSIHYSDTLSISIVPFAMIAQKCPSLTELILSGVQNFTMPELALLPPSVRYLTFDSMGEKSPLNVTIQSLVESVPRDLVALRMSAKLILLGDDGKPYPYDDAEFVQDAKERIFKMKPRWRSFSQGGVEPIHLFWQNPLSVAEFDNMAMESLW